MSSSKGTKVFELVSPEDDVDEELSQEERKVLQALRSRSVAARYTDRFLMACLLARKMDVSRAEELLKKNWLWRIRNGYEHLPSFSSLDLSLLRTGLLSIAGTRSLNGCGILYFSPASIMPGSSTYQSVIDILVWYWGIGMEKERVDAHREGVIIVQDMSGFSWKNFDTRFERHIAEAMQDHFPQRVKKILLLNPPVILRAVLAVLRVIMKKKMMDRFEVVDLPGLLRYVSADQLWTRYGGKVEYSVDTWISDLTKWSRAWEDYQEKTRKIMPVAHSADTGLDLLTIKRSLEFLEQQTFKQDTTVLCPVCAQSVSPSEIEAHVQSCLRRATVEPASP